MYSLNLKNNIVLKLCELTEAQKLERFYSRNSEMEIILKDFLKKIKDEDLVNVTVFGSVAKEKYTKESDIDILVITNKKKDFSSELRKIHAEYGKNISVINLTKKEFKERRTEPIIKEIIKNHLILSGYEYFISEALTNE